MGPTRDSREPNEANGNTQHAEKDKGKAKAKGKVSKTSSEISLLNLTPDAIDKGVDAVKRLSKILVFMQAYGDEMDGVEAIYGHHVRQQTRIDELNKVVDELSVRKNEEMRRLQDENEAYRANLLQFEHDRKELKQEQATMKDIQNAMQVSLEKQKKQEIRQAELEFSKRYEARVRQAKEDAEKDIQPLKTERDGLESAIKALEERNVQALKALKEQNEALKVDKRSSQSHIKHLESQLEQINAASTVSSQTSDFYIDGFQQLWERIQDVADNYFKVLPVETKPLEDKAVQEKLFNASAIFRYPPLSSESPVATFLRVSAVKNFLTTKVIAIIERQYFAETTGATQRISKKQPIDWILDTISSVPGATSSQDLSWRLITVEKLDRLGSQRTSERTTIATVPDQGHIVEGFWESLRYLQSPADERVRAQLAEIANIAIKLWRALRKDNCRIQFDHSPSELGHPDWRFVGDMVTKGSEATNPPSEFLGAQLPTEPFVLFPRIVGSFGAEGSKSRVLHTGFALSSQCPAFEDGLQEIVDIDNYLKEVKLNMRKGSSAQSSPVVSKRPADWYLATGGST